MFRFWLILLTLGWSSGYLNAVELKCITERSFDAEDYGVTGDSTIDEKQSFTLSIDMEFAKAAMQERDYRDIVLSPTVIMMEHIEGPASDGKIYKNTTKVQRDTLAVETELFVDNRPHKKWEGDCQLLRSD